MSEKYIFVGNRRFVLEEMLKAPIELVAVIIIAGTHLQRDVEQGRLDLEAVGRVETITGKQQLLDLLNELDFDILVSNGCPYILPISKMKPAVYANIHPSCLPDLKGVDPTIGAILYGRDSGATCHIMNDKIDAGDIISQIRIPFSEDLDVSLLYQLSFIAEKEAFREALKNQFAPHQTQQPTDDLIYYTRSFADRAITFSESNDQIIRKTKSFCNKSQGCYFMYCGVQYRCYEAQLLRNSFLHSYSRKFSNLEILFVYEDEIVFKKDDQVMKLSKVCGDLSAIRPGQAFTSTQLTEFNAQ